MILANLKKINYSDVISEFLNTDILEFQNVEEIKKLLSDNQDFF